MIQLISIIAGLFNLAAGTFYLRQVIKNESTPNPTTWVIWVMVTIINAATYFSVVKDNPWIALASGVTALMVFLIFITSLFKGKFTKLNYVDIASLILAVVVGVFWQVSGNAIISNIFLQIVFIISFYPTIHSLIVGVAKEKPLPWFLGSCSYILQILNILLNPITLWALVFPITQLIGQGAIALLSYFQNYENS